MKKLLILTAVSAMACVSQAYSIQWGCLNVKTPVAKDVKVDQTGITGTGVAMAGLAINLYWIDKSGNDQLIGTYYTGKDANAGKSTGNILGDGTDSDLYKVMLADQGDTWKPQYHMTASYSTDDGVYTFSGNVSSTVALGDLTSKNVGATANFGSIAGWSYTANVPEPTSGLLLLLGVAGLALRRRRA